MVQGPTKTGSPRAIILGAPNVAESLRGLAAIRNPRAFRAQLDRGFGDLSTARQELASLIFRSTLADEVQVARELMKRMVPDRLSALLAVNPRARDRALAEITSDRLSLAGDELLAARDVLTSLKACLPTLIPISQALQAVEIKIAAAPVPPLPPLSPAVPDTINTPLSNLGTSLGRIRTIFTAGAVRTNKTEYENKNLERNSLLTKLNQLLRFVSWGGEVRTAADGIKKNLVDIDSRLNDLAREFEAIREMLEELGGSRAAGTHKKVPAGAAVEIAEMEKELEKALEAKRQAEKEAARKLAESQAYQKTVIEDVDLMQVLGKSPMIRQGIEAKLESDQQAGEKIKALIQTMQESVVTISGELTAELPATPALVAVPVTAADEVVRPNWKMITLEMEGLALGLQDVAAKWPGLKQGLEKFAEAVSKVRTRENDYGFDAQRAELFEALGMARSIMTALLDPSADQSMIKPVALNRFDHEDLKPVLEAVLTKLLDKLAQLNDLRLTDLPAAHDQNDLAKTALDEAISLTNDPLFKDLLAQLEHEEEIVMQAGEKVVSQNQVLSPMLAEKFIWIEEIPAASSTDPLQTIKTDLAKILAPGGAAAVNATTNGWVKVTELLAKAEFENGLADGELKLLFEQVRAMVPPFVKVDFGSFRDQIETREYDNLRNQLPSIIAGIRYRVPLIGETLSDYLRSNVLQKFETFKDERSLKDAIIKTINEALRNIILPAAVAAEVKEAALIAWRAFSKKPSGTPSIPPPPPPPPGARPAINSPRELSEAIAKYSGASWPIFLQAIKNYFKAFRPEIQTEVEKTLGGIDPLTFTSLDTLREEIDLRIRKVIYDGRLQGYRELDQFEIEYIGV